MNCKKEKRATYRTRKERSRLVGRKERSIPGERVCSLLAAVACAAGLTGVDSADQSAPIVHGTSLVNRFFGALQDGNYKRGAAGVCNGVAKLCESAV